jgi:type IV pilus assembly protein PilB
MGIESYLVAASLSGIIAQRLIKKICPKCKESYEAKEFEKKLLGIEEDEPLKLYRGAGCNYCNNTGYHDRTGIYEIMEISREHRAIMQGGIDLDKIREISIENGTRTLKMACVNLVLEGDTTIEELTKVAFLKD